MDPFFGDFSDDEEYFDGGGGHHQVQRQRRQLPQVPQIPLSFNWLDLDAYGFPQSVALSELPGSKFRGRHRDLTTDIRTLRSHDISDIVCLLTENEFRKFRVPNLLNDYENAGFIVYHLPIEDGMIPNNVGAFTHLLSQIRKRVADGYRVLAHCFGGLGRAVLLGACLMLTLDQDLSPEDVINHMRELRGPRAVQSVKQFNFIYEFREIIANYEEDTCVSR